MPAIYYYNFYVNTVSFQLLAMETVKNPFIQEALNVLLVGNNPIEMGFILDKLDDISVLKVIPEIAFDISSALERLKHFQPNFILIDDNLDREKLFETVRRFSLNRKTKEVPIAILKNSNYKDTVPSASVLDYILKQNLSPVLLYNVLRNSQKFRRTQLSLYQTYRKRKRTLLGYRKS